MEGSEATKATRNKVMEIFERLDHLNALASDSVGSSRRIRDLLLGPPEEQAPQTAEDRPEPPGILDRMIDAIGCAHQKLLRTRDLNQETIQDIKPSTQLPKYATRK